MGKVRARQFDAVIGIGGVGAEPRSYGIDRRVNWVGIGRHEHPSSHGFRGPLISFDRIVLPETEGPLLKEWPALFRHMYNTNRRVVMSDELPNEILKDVQSILKLAEDTSPSRARSGTQVTIEASARDEDYPKSQGPCLCHPSRPSGRYRGSR